MRLFGQGYEISLASSVQNRHHSYSHQLVTVFLEPASYYLMFLRQYVMVVDPFHDMLQEGDAFSLPAKQSWAFQKLKSLVKNHATAAVFNPSLQNIVKADEFSSLARSCL